MNLPVFHFSEVGSTNDEAFNLGRDRGLETAWVISDIQLTGKGRSGRQWISEKGNLYTSVYLKSPAPMAKCATLSFVAAVSVAQAVETLIGTDVNLQVKWPNDLLLDGKKVCGILLEARNIENTQDFVIGFGVNIAHAPENTLYSTTFLNHEGKSLLADDLAKELRRAFATNLVVWNNGDGFRDIRTAWIKRAAGIGSTITVRTPTKEMQGVFRRLDSDGCLILEHQGGEVKVSAGDVFFSPVSQ